MGPETRGFEINLVTKRFSTFTASTYIKPAKTESVLNLSDEEIGQIKEQIVIHFERAGAEESITERMATAIEENDVDTVKKLNATHPSPIGGFAALMVEIEIHRGDLDFVFSNQFGEAKSYEAFQAWIFGMLAKAARPKEDSDE